MAKSPFPFVNSERFTKFRGLCNRFFLSAPFFILLFFCSAFIPIFKCELQATIVYCVLLSILLVVCDDILTVFLPVLFLSTFVTRCYNSYDLFMPYLPLLILPVLALLLHFLFYPQKWKIGKTFWGLCAVAVAVTLSGIGAGTPLGVTSWISFYYIFGLGIGLVICDLLLRSQLEAERTYDRKQKFSEIMTWMGAFVFFCISVFYVEGYGAWRETGSFPDFQSSNNLATLLLLAMPFPALLSLQKKRYLPLLPLFFVGTLLSTSRGGAIMGVATFLLCLIYLTVFDKKLRFLYPAVMLITLACGVYFFPTFAIKVWKYTEIPENANIFECLEVMKTSYSMKEEVRYKMLTHLWDDFRAHPIFGNGLFFRGNEEFYTPVKGAMNWYHMWGAQIVGSMGTVGILAYGYQLFERIRYTFKQKSAVAWGFFLSYTALWLMSQVNPGEFCPMPYALIAVILFI